MQYDSIKKCVGESRETIGLLVDATRSRELRMVVVATLGVLATLDSVKRLIGECGGFGPLVEAGYLMKDPIMLSAGGVVRSQLILSL